MQENKILPKKKPLTLKDRLYLKNLEEARFNQTQAYLETYPNSTYKSANAQSSVKTKRLVKNSISIKDEITEDWILNKLKEFVLKSKKASDKIRATELLGKWKAMFTDKIENKGTQTLTIQEKDYIRDLMCSRNN